jgi:hypothetical protein
MPTPKSKTRGPTRAKTLARLEEVAHDIVGDDTPLDHAFAAFSAFDDAERQHDAEAIAKAKAAVLTLLSPLSS